MPFARSSARFWLSLVGVILLPRLWGFEWIGFLMWWIIVLFTAHVNIFLWAVKSMIGKWLKEERERLGFSQTEFAVFAGITRRPYAEWEVGRTSPTAAQLAALAAAGADVLYIVTGERDGPPPLKPDERELLALFRAAPLAVKAAAVGALSAGGMSSGGIKLHVGGNFTGQAVDGDLTNKGQVNINSAKGKKKK